MALDRRTGHLKESTRSRNAGVVEDYIVPRWGRTPLAGVTYAEVQTWVAELTRKGIAPRSATKVLGVFRQMLAWAVRDGRLTRNPAEGPLPRPALHTYRYLDHSEVAMLVKECGRYGSLVRLLAYTGLRWGEVAALRFREVDLRRRIHVVASVTEVNGHLVWSTPKTHARGTVPVPRFIAAELAPLTKGRDDDALLFMAPRGGVLRVRNFRRNTFDPAVRKNRARWVPSARAPAHCGVAGDCLGRRCEGGADGVGARDRDDGFGSLRRHLFPGRLDDLADRMDSAACAPNVPQEGDGDEGEPKSPR